MPLRRCGLIIGIGIPTGWDSAYCPDERESRVERENRTVTRKRLLLALLVTMLMIPLGALGLRAIPVSAASTHQVPFTGSYSGAASFTDPSVGSFFSGNGIATYLGASTNKGHAILTGSDSSCPGGIANTHYETLTAPSGDVLMITSYDVACPISPNVFHGTGHWTVSGGTGRFSGASGAGAFDGHSDFNQGVFSFQLTGSISAPTQG
jgi:hypothetical protein